MVNITKKSFSSKRSLLSMLFEPIVGYTRIVLAAKAFLIFLAILLIVLLIAIPLFNPVNEDFKISFSSLETSNDDEKAVMVNPRFQSVDDKGQPFNISSKTALKESEDVIILNNPKGDITFLDRKWLNVVSKKGKLEIENKRIELSDGVDVLHADGYKIKTSSVTINLENNSLKGDEVVKMSGELGDLEANSFEVIENEQRLIFTGGVKMIIYTDQIKN